MINRIRLALLPFLFVSCWSPKADYQKLDYAHLPISVKEKFIVLFNLNIKKNNWACENTNPQCVCSIEYEKKFLVPDGDLVITKCNEDKTSIPVGISSARLFVVGDDGVYFTFVEPFGYTEESLYKDVIKMDSIGYGFIANR